MTSLDKVALSMEARIPRTANHSTVRVGMAVLALAEQRNPILMPSLVNERGTLTVKKWKERR